MRRIILKTTARLALSNCKRFGRLKDETREEIIEAVVVLLDATTRIDMAITDGLMGVIANQLVVKEHIKTNARGWKQAYKQAIKPWYIKLWERIKRWAKKYLSLS